MTVELNAREKSLVDAVKDKLDSLPLAFDIDDVKVFSALKDTLREMRIFNAEHIYENTELEYYVEIRTEWHMLKRLRNSTSVYFRYSTGVDGKSIDKTRVPQMISEIMEELDAEYKKWYMTSRMNGGVWNMYQRPKDTLREM